jgi:hypothetical protein
LVSSFYRHLPSENLFTFEKKFTFDILLAYIPTVKMEVARGGCTGVPELVKVFGNHFN